MDNVISDMEIIRDYAIKSHGSQMYGDKPYVYHLDMVAELVAPFGCTAQTIAYLHDVIENTNVDAESICMMFGPFVATCVSILSDEYGKNRRERKSRTNTKLSSIRQGSADEVVLIVKTADRLANLIESSKESSSKLEMYVKEYEDFRKAVYRPGLCDSLWDQIDSIIKSAQ